MSFSLNRSSSRIVAACMAATVLLAAMPAHAEMASRGDIESAAQAFAGGVTLDQAVAQAEKRYNARVVNTETLQADGKTIYALRLLSADGHVTDIRVDASTGAVL